MIISNFSVITDQNQFLDLYYRILWYFSPYAKLIEKIYLICERKYDLDRIPSYFDSKIELQDLHTSKKKDREKKRTEIMKLLGGEIQLRSKRELIEKFINY